MVLHMHELLLVSGLVPAATTAYTICSPNSLTAVGGHTSILVELLDAP